MQLTKRTTYSSLDIAKFLCAVSIIAAHFSSERASFPPAVDMVFSVYIVAVPFFFCCSGFLFFDKLQRLDGPEKRTYFVRYVRRIVLMYLAWSGIYFVFVVIGWIRDGVTVAGVLSYFHEALVFTTYATIWFLPALVAAVCLLYFLHRRCSWKVLLALSAVLYVLGAFGYSYAPAIASVEPLRSLYSAYETVCITTRNGVFNGFPLVTLGAWVAAHPRTATGRRSWLFPLIGCAVFGVGFVAEAVLVKTLLHPVGMDTIFLLVPFVYCLLRFLLAIRLRERKVYQTLRHLSLLMFVSQRLFLSALPSVFPVLFTQYLWANSYLGLLLTLGLVIGFSYLVIRLTAKFHWLKVLW